MPEGQRRIGDMGWESLPFGCVGLVRKLDVDGKRVAWSWLILIPWAAKDAKPWIDGTHLMPVSLADDEEQRAQVVTHMREVLDQRYGKTLGEKAVDDFLGQFQKEE